MQQHMKRGLHAPGCSASSDLAHVVLQVVCSAVACYSLVPCQRCDCFCCACTSRSIYHICLQVNQCAALVQLTALQRSYVMVVQELSASRALWQPASHALLCSLKLVASMLRTTDTLLGAQGGLSVDQRSSAVALSLRTVVWLLSTAPHASAYLLQRLQGTSTCCRVMGPLVRGWHWCQTQFLQSGPTGPCCKIRSRRLSRGPKRSRSRPEKSWPVQTQWPQCMAGPIPLAACTTLSAARCGRS